MILSKESYFSAEANQTYMSVSQFKSFEQCEFKGLSEVRGTYTRPSTTALLVGSYVDAHFEKTLDIFRAQHPELFKRDGTLKADYIQAEKIIQRVARDPFFMKYMSGESQVVMTGEIEGVPVKIKIDSYHPGKAIVDLKIMRDLLPIFVRGQGLLNFIEAWRYDMQGAVYQEIVRQNTGETLPFFIAAATKETEPDIAVIEVPRPNLQACLEIFKANAPRYHALKHGISEPIRCERCEACRQTKVLSGITTWEELNKIGTE